MKVEIKGGIRDVLSFAAHIRKRKRIFRAAPSLPVSRGEVNLLAEKLHPLEQRLAVESIRSETPDTKTYRLKGVDRNPAYFLPGQYVSFGFPVEGSTAWRALSVSSLPEKTVNEGIYEITVKSGDPGGFIGPWIFAHWKEGTEVTASGPAGNFFYQKLRDSNLLVFVAGGSGITPFKPLAVSILEGDPEARIILFQGAASESELIFRSFWEELEAENKERFSWVPVLTDPAEDPAGNPDGEWNGERGFISAGLITAVLEKNLKINDPKECSFFICGPPGLHEYIDLQLAELKIPRKRIRREEYPVNIRESVVSGAVAADFYNLTVRQGGAERIIKADYRETVLVALERAGLNPPSLCRSGECGWCRSRLVSGKVSPAKPGESGVGGLRKADEKFGYIHPCSVFPESDLVLEIPENPVVVKIPVKKE